MYKIHRTTPTGPSLTPSLGSPSANAGKRHTGTYKLMREFSSERGPGHILAIPVLQAENPGGSSSSGSSSGSRNVEGSRPSGKKTFFPSSESGVGSCSRKNPVCAACCS